MLAIHANEETLCLQRLCSSVGFVKRVVMLDCDRQSAILLEKNHAYHDNTKNISHWLSQSNLTAFCTNQTLEHGLCAGICVFCVFKFYS